MLGAPLKEKEAKRHRQNNQKIKTIQMEQFLNSRKVLNEILIHWQRKSSLKVLNILKINFRNRLLFKMKLTLKLYQLDQFQVLDCKFHKKVALKEGKLNMLKIVNLLF